VIPRYRARVDVQAIDERLKDAWEQSVTMDFPLTDEQAWKLIRMAYGKGYVDSLQSPEPLREAEQLGLDLRPHQ
jgi:hypothetical protein